MNIKAYKHKIVNEETKPHGPSIVPYLVTFNCFLILVYVF